LQSAIFIAPQLVDTQKTEEKCSPRSVDAAVELNPHAVERSWACGVAHPEGAALAVVPPGETVYLAHEQVESGGRCPRLKVGCEWISAVGIARRVAPWQQRGGRALNQDANERPDTGRTVSNQGRWYDTCRTLRA
jgi:hypothetical protein